MATVVRWNGKELPEELRSLPAGRYVVEPIDDLPPLTPEEEAGIEAALDSLRRGEGVEASDARRRIDAAIRR
jgi:hypothetical protein